MAWLGSMPVAHKACATWQGDSRQDSRSVPQSASNDTAGEVAVNPKITPRLPPPPPPMQQNSTPPVASACSGYVTKEEIVSGLEYAAGQEYLPFDPWSAAAPLQALLPMNSQEGWCAMREEGHNSLLQQICSCKALPSWSLAGFAHHICIRSGVPLRSSCSQHRTVASRTMKHGCLCSWDVRLAALKGYYGQPKSTIFPFAYLNPGGYISNVTFWLNALKDYELGRVSHCISHRASLSGLMVAPAQHTQWAVAELGIVIVSGAEYQIRRTQRQSQASSRICYVLSVHALCAGTIHHDPQQPLVPEYNQRYRVLRHQRPHWRRRRQLRRTACHAARKAHLILPPPSWHYRTVRSTLLSSGGAVSICPAALVDRHACREMLLMLGAGRFRTVGDKISIMHCQVSLRTCSRLFSLRQRVLTISAS